MARGGELDRVSVERQRLRQSDAVAFQHAVARAAREFETIAVVEQGAVGETVVVAAVRNARIAVVAREDHARGAVVIDETHVMDVDLVAAHACNADAEVADLQAGDLDVMRVVNRKSRAVVTAHIGSASDDPGCGPHARGEIEVVRRARTRIRRAWRDQVRSVEHDRR